MLKYFFIYFTFHGACGIIASRVCAKTGKPSTNFFTRGTEMAIVSLMVGDILVMKKKHPCSSDRFRVARCASDVRIICLGCGRDLMLPREKVEKMAKSVIHPDGE